jgi:hypothetical protein
MLTFHFDRSTHTYTDGLGVQLPSVTQLLRRAGLVDDTWYTQASRDRGRLVHQLTADLDLGVRELEEIERPWHGYVAAYQKACRALQQPSWNEIEVPRFHRELRFCGTPDRHGFIFGAASVLEIKSGADEPAHVFQTALQCLLVAEDYHLPPEALKRYTLYLQANGRFTVDEHVNATDFSRARAIVKRYCA